MTNKDFETLVLEKLSKIDNKVSGLDDKVSGLNNKVSGLEIQTASLHRKFDRLDDRLDSVEKNLTQEIRVQGAYLNQAFDRMSYMQSAGQFNPKK